MNQRRLGNIAVISAIIIFSLNFISMKYLVKYIPPFGLIFLRFALASIFFNIVILFRKEKHIIKKDDKKKVVLAGFVGIVIYYCFQTIALIYISASLAALICGLIPIFTLLTKVFIDKRRLALSELLIFLISIVGVFLVLDMGLKELFSSSEIIGFLYMLLAVLSWIVYTILTYSLQNSYDTLTLISKQFNASTIILLIISIIDLPKMLIAFKQVEILPILIGNLLFVGIICSALGYFFYIYGMEKLGVEISSLYMNLLPALTAIISYFVLDEILNTKQIIGIVIVLICLYVNGYIDLMKAKNNTPNTELQKA
ncbi:DMT family transporter [Alkaliphilus pronyensis]|uniref:DMT family transporter n=1 Tax=Alkaliphilus pronyensis TaxID=1482732 RepID=A0A6I0F8J3_9FIRM|nr:DMT family transporter [Alkaliphilus pronyensis]KAB3539040.1 DMT family transporter [Alkaliphilus pronyensis]